MRPEDTAKDSWCPLPDSVKSTHRCSTHKLPTCGSCIRHGTGNSFHVLRTTKAHPVDLGTAIRTIAHRRPPGGGAIHPSAGAKRLLCAGLGAFRVLVRRGLVIILIVPIRDPLGHISDGLVEAILTHGVLVLVDRNNRRIKQQPLRPVPHRTRQAGPAEIRSGWTGIFVAPRKQSPVYVLSSPLWADSIQPLRASQSQPASTSSLESVTTWLPRQTNTGPSSSDSTEEHGALSGVISVYLA